MLLAACATPQVVPTAVPPSAPETRRGQFASTFTYKDVTLRQLVYLPAKFDPAKPWPVILNLHGAAHNGADLNLLKRDGTLPELMERSPKLEAIVLSPQIEGGNWQTRFDALNALLDDAARRYNADPDRIFLTGWDTGGEAAWLYAFNQPHRFAGLLPVASKVPLNKEQLCKLNHLPIFGMHGAEDKQIPSELVQLASLQIRDCGGNILMRTFEKTPHEAWRTAYANNEWGDWLAFRVRPKRAG